MPNPVFALTWDQDGERLYETGVDHGVLFPRTGGTYGDGVAWNGLTSVEENPSGAENTAVWADNIKYLNLTSAEDYGFTIGAYTYPDEWAECDGSKAVKPGIYIGQQERKKFAFSWRSRIGNDEDGTEHGYKIHIAYNCSASPSSRAHNTINDSPEAAEMSWEVTTTPTPVTGHKPTAHIYIDSTLVDATKLASFESILYGTAASGNDPAVAPRCPLPDEIANTIFA